MTINLGFFVFITDAEIIDGVEFVRFDPIAMAFGRSSTSAVNSPDSPLKKGWVIKYPVTVGARTFVAWFIRLDCITAWAASLDPDGLRRIGLDDAAKYVEKTRSEWNQLSSRWGIKNINNGVLL